MLMTLDHASNVAVLVPGEDEETARVAADRLVLPVGDIERLAAILVAALADKSDQERVLFAVAGESGLELGDPLVHLAENSFVLGPPQPPRLLGREGEYSRSVRRGGG
jgi:hypothetical protein